MNQDDLVSQSSLSSNMGEHTDSEEQDGQTEKQAKSQSPLSKIIPKISTKTVKPLINSFMGKLEDSNLAEVSTRRQMAEMFIEIIETISNLILDAFRNIILEGTDRDRSLLVSEEEVEDAVHDSLNESFESVLDSDRDIDHLSSLIIEEVTNSVNSVLSQSHLKGKKLKVSEERTYSPPKYKLKGMVRFFKIQLRSIKDKMKNTCVRRSQQPSEGESIVHQRSRSQHETSERTESEHNSRRKTKKRSKKCLLSCIKPDTESVSSTEESSLIEEVKEILMIEAMEISGEDQSSLSEYSQQTASSIISHITEQISSGADTTSHKNYMKGVADKIKSFFALCYAKVSYRRLLCKMCVSSDSVVSTHSLEEVMKESSPHLQELVQVEGDVYVTLPKQIALRQVTDVAETLTNVIATNMALEKARPEFRKKVRVQVQTFMDMMSLWLRDQAKQAGATNRVQRVLGRIRRTVIKMFGNNQGPFPKAQPLKVTYSQEAVLFREELSEAPAPPLTLYKTPGPCPRHRKGAVHTAPEHTAPAQSVSRTPSVTAATPGAQWSSRDIHALVHKLVSRIFQRKWSDKYPEMVALSQNLVLYLNQHISDWDVQMDPKHYKDVAAAIHKDLCRDSTKTLLCHAIVCNKEKMIPTVLKSIQWHLELPLRKKTFTSILRSMWGGRI